MSDLSGVNDTLPVRIGGVSSSTGLPDNYADVNAGGSLQVAGQGVAGTPAGGVVSIQGVTSGTAVSVTGTNFPTAVDTNYGAVGASTLRTAAQIGNATGAADFAAGNSSAQTLRVVIATNQATLPISAASLPLPTGAATETTLSALNTKVTTTVNGIKVDGSAVTQPVSGTVAATQSGAWSTGRTWTLASGTDSVSAVQSGTWTVQPGNTANTTPWLVTVATALPAGSNNIGSVNQGTSPWITKDQADGPVTPGTVASFSELIGGQFNTSLPTLTNTQQSAIQLDSSGRLIVAPLTNSSIVKAQLQDNAGTSITLGQKVMTSSVPVVIASDQSTIPVSAASLPLPTGAATSALQTTGNASLSSIDSKTPALGQALAAASVPVVLTAAQITTLTPLTTVAVTQSTSPWVVSATSLPLPTGAATEATLSAFNTKFNQDFGISSGAIRVAALLGNATGAALFGAGTTTAQVLRVVLPTDQTTIPINFNDISPANGSITALDTGTSVLVGSNGQNFYIGTPTANSAATFALASIGQVAIQVNLIGAGGTLVVEVSMDGGTFWVRPNVFQISTQNYTNGFTAPFIATVNTTDMTNIRVRSTVSWAGTATVIVKESLNTHMVTIADSLPTGANVIGSVTQSGAWTVQQGTPPWSVGGNVASGATDSGNSVKIGGPFNTTQPTVTTGQRVDAQFTSRGALIVGTGVDSFNVNNISGTVTLPTGAATAANQATEITALNTIDTDIKASQPRKLQDGAGNNITSTIGGAKRALDVNLIPQTTTSDIFGASIIGIRKTQFTGSFQYPIATQNVTQTTSGTGTITQPNESAVISTGTGTTALAKVVSNQIVTYQPGKEIFAEFTAAFTAPTSAVSYQRIGLYDGSNGFFIGYSGTSFGLTVRNNGSDTFTSQASFNGDTLSAAAGSLFTRNGIAESINQTFKNVFRIRFGWFGSAQIIFEVLSPDGGWIVFHTIKQPNTTSSSSILSPSLPMTAETSKTASDSTNLQITMTCWDVGTSAVQGMDIAGVGSILSVSGAITVNCANGYNTVNFSLSGTWSGTLIARGSMGDGQFYQINFYNTAGNSVTSTTSNSLLSVPTNGYTIIQLFASSWTSGTVVASWNCSTATVAPSGTVSVSPLPATGSGFSFGQLATSSSVAYLAVEATTYTEPTTNSTMTIVSSSANDAAAGTGARIATVTYLDQTGAGPFTTSFTLNGTTPVTAGVSNMCFVEKIVVSTVGSTGSNVGILTLKTGGAVTVGTIAATNNQTFWAHHYVPVTKTSYISGFSFGNNATAAGNGAQFILKASTPTVANTPEIQISDVVALAGVSNTTTRTYLSTIQVVGPARIRAYVLPYANAATSQFASFDYIDN